MAGLRERKKQQTREEIFGASQRLFARHGFEDVTVASIAREANVSEMTVFNHFPTKEDLFYAGMQFFEDRLLDAVQSRPAGEAAVTAFRRAVVAGADALAERGRAESIRRSSAVIAASPSLAAREREIVDAYTQRLAAILGDARDPVPLTAAAAMMAAHRALVAYTRRRVAAGRRGAGLAEDFRVEARSVFAILQDGLARYAVKA